MEKCAFISNNVLVSSTQVNDENELEIGETSNQNKSVDNCDGEAPLYEAQMELKYFPDVEEIEFDDESSQETSGNQNENFLADGIKTVTIITNDILEVRNKLSNIAVNSEVIQEKLKIQDIEYKAIEKRADCFNLFLDLKLKELDCNPNAEHKQFTDEEIKKFLSL